MVRVEVVYVDPDQRVFQRQIELNQGQTVKSALVASQLYLDYPETQSLDVGIFGKLVELDRIVENGDRIEVYRALTRDPKERRRVKAKKIKS